MRLIDTIEFKVPGTDDDPGWHFDLTIPPLDVADEICRVFDELDANRRAMFASLMADETIRLKIEDLSIREAFEQPSVIAKMCADGAHEKVSVSTASKARLADLVLQYVGQPEGLTDDGGGALTWDTAKARNPWYAREVLFRAAEAVYSYVQGEAAGLAAKNLQGSSPQ